MTAKMKRREFITLVGGAAAAWPLAARAADWQGSNNPDSYRGHVLGLGPLDCTFCGIAANMMPAIKSRGSHPIR